MKYSDSKLAEFKKGDRGSVFDTKEVVKVNNGYPNKYFNVVFDNGKRILVHLSNIKWVSYIEPLENIPIEEISKKLE